MTRASYTSQQNKIQKQIERLQKQMEALANKQRTPEINAIIKTMRKFDITPDEIAAAYNKRAGKTAGTRKAATKRVSAPVPPKYRHPQTGATWTGRGRAPRWVTDAETAGQSREQFLIPTNTPTPTPSE